MPIMHHRRSALELEAVLSRTNTSLARLESIGMERFEGVSVDGVEGERAQPVVPGARRYGQPKA